MLDYQVSQVAAEVEGGKGWFDNYIIAINLYQGRGVRYQEVGIETPAVDGPLYQVCGDGPVGGGHHLQVGPPGDAPFSVRRLEGTVEDRQVGR
ncbi:MAG: hypothetical protein IIA63_06860, partial [Nitrospinae bacterium]|nr:hypothetical protein [Nitrospinota bacterium]